MPGADPTLNRKPSKFNCLGIDLAHPVDMMSDGYYPYVSNCRSVVAGTVQVRPGYTTVGAGLGAPVHSIRRVNNLLPGSSSPNQLFLGVGTSLYAGPAAAGPFTSIATGFSGSPLSSVIFRPDQSPESWIYIADKNKNVKANCEQIVRNVGIAPPNVAPTPEIDTIDTITFMEGDDATGWVGDGVVVTSNPSVVDRAAASTTVGVILYDAGSVGFCTISPTTPTGEYNWLQQGCSVRLNNAENVVVQEVHEEAGFPDVMGVCSTSGTAVTWVSGSTFGGETVGDPITINGVQYIVAVVTDSHHITLATSAGTQTNVPFSGNPSTTIAAILYDSGSTGLCSIALSDPSPNISRNSILLLDTNDTVRVLSVSQGLDGLYSLRCSTPNNHVAGGLVRSIISFRCYTFTTIAATNTITAKALEFDLVIPAGDIAGIGFITALLPINASSIGSRPVTPDDYMHISIKIDNPANLLSGTISLSIDPNETAASFNGNYFYKQFTPNDLQPSANNSLQPLTVQQSAVQNTAITTQAPSQAANPIQLATGEAQWFELVFPISDLVRSGTNSTLSLATVSALCISLTSIANMTVDVAAWYVEGTYGPDVQQGSPVGISYQYRYRDSRTGAKSVPSPACRYQLYPVRQAISVGVTASTDPQVDTIDIQRFDPSLALLVYVGSTPNTTGSQFIDDTAAAIIAGNPPLETTVFQPWPTLAPPLTGFVNVAGTSIQWVSGNQFPLSLQPGSLIQIGGSSADVVQTYGQPYSLTSLHLQSNLGALTNVPYTIAAPTLLGQPLPVMFGPLEGPTAIYAFAVGDPLNPGTLYWTNGNDLDSANDSNFLEISSPSEPLVTGVVWQTLIYVATAKRVFLITPSFGQDSTGTQTIVLTATELTSISGSFSPWGMSKGQQGVYMIGRDGLYQLNYNSGSYFSQQIYPLFPHDGQSAVTTNSFNPINLTLNTVLRLSYCDASLLFDYQDSMGNPCTMQVDANGNFWPQAYADAVLTHYWEEVPEGTEPRMLMGTADGYILAAGGTTDNTIPLFGTIRTPSMDYGDPRTLKLFMDMMTDADATGGYQITCGFNNYEIAVGIGTQAVSTGRNQYLNSISSVAAAGLVLYRNIAAQYVMGAGTVLYEFEPSFYSQPFYSNLYTTQFMDHGIPGWKQLRFGRIALISTGPVTIQILNDDGVLLNNFTVPSTGGILFNDFVQLQNASKGRLLRYSASADTQFVLFTENTFVRIKKWGGQQFLEIAPFVG